LECVALPDGVWCSAIAPSSVFGSASQASLHNNIHRPGPCAAARLRAARFFTPPGSTMSAAPGAEVADAPPPANEGLRADAADDAVVAVRAAASALAAHGTARLFVAQRAAGALLAWCGGAGAAAACEAARDARAMLARDAGAPAALTAAVYAHPDAESLQTCCHNALGCLQSQLDDAQPAGCATLPLRRGLCT
jgi:hypothetical protein